MNHGEIWNHIKSFIDKRDNFLITTHVSPDGDALGSELALALTLQKLGKNCHIVNSSPTPDNYRFLDPENQIAEYNPNQHFSELRIVEGVFILDISDWARLRNIGKVIRELDLPRVCIDHHQRTDKIAPIEIIDPKASCTGELLYDFFNFISERPAGRVAEALYTCLLTDTGSFRFSNTTPKVHQLAAELLLAGADYLRIYEQVYETCSPAKVRLMGEALRHLKYECEGRLAWFLISQRMLRETGAKTWELETFPEIPRIVGGVEVSIMFTEINQNRTKVSIRSKGRIPIGRVAGKFGGGGHKFAAGATIAGPSDQVVERVLDESRRVVANFFAEATSTD